MPEKSQTKQKSLGDAIKSRPYFYGSIAVIMISIIAFVSILTISNLNKTGQAPPFKLEACGPYQYCSASNQDDSKTFAEFNNKLRMTERQVRIFKEWLKQNGRTGRSQNDNPQAGNVLSIFSTDTEDGSNKPFTDGEVRQLLRSIDPAEPDQRGRIFVFVDPKYIEGSIIGDIQLMEFRLNDKVLDYSGQNTRFTNESEWKLFVGDVNFNQTCPVDPCGDVVEIS